MSHFIFRRRFGILGWIGVAALLLRIGVIFFLSDRGTAYYEYMLIAKNLLAGLGYSYDDAGSMTMQPTSLFPPLYVYFCALFMWLSPANFLPFYVAQAIIAATGVIPAYRIGSRLHSEKIGLVFALLYATYPELIILACRPVPEFVFVVAGLWTIDFYLKCKLRISKNLPGFKSAVLLGLISGVGMLIKESSALILLSVLIALGIGFGFRTHTMRRILLPCVITAGLVVLPWTVRNYLVQHELIPLRTGWGFNLWLGNNPYSEGTPRTSSGNKVQFSLPEEYARTHVSDIPPDEQDRDRFYFDLAIRHIIEDPMRYLSLCGHRLWFMLWFDETHPLAVNGIYRISYLALLALALPGAFIWWKKKPREILFPILVVAFILFYVPVLMLPRYRIFSELIFLLLASLTIERLLRIIFPMKNEHALHSPAV